MPGPADDRNDDGEWRFSLDDLPDLGEEDGDAAVERGTDESEGSVAGGFAPSDVIEPGEIDPENAFFVLVGVLLASLFVGGFLVTIL